MEYGRLTKYDIVIEPTYNKRAVVRTGCGVFAFNGADEICEFVKQYITDSDAIRKHCIRVIEAQQLEDSGVAVPVPGRDASTCGIKEDDMNFNDWWEKHPIQQSKNIIPFMKVEYKLVALEAWEAAIKAEKDSNTSTCGIKEDEKMGIIDEDQLIPKSQRLFADPNSLIAKLITRVDKRYNTNLLWQNLDPPVQAFFITLCTILDENLPKVGDKPCA